MYLGYGFKQPKPGKWVVTLLTTNATPPTGADYAIMAVFQGGATLTAHTDKTVPGLREVVNISAELTKDGQPVPMLSAQAVLRYPNGEAGTIDMVINGNSATLEITPTTSGIYGIEVNVTAEATDGTPIDRAAFLSFEAQPTGEQVTTTRVTLGAVILVVILGAIFILRRRKKRKS